MSEQKNSFLYIGEDGKADWGVPEGYPRKEGVTIEWDGNTEGLDAVDDAVDGVDFKLYRVSDVVLSNEQIKTGFIKDSVDREFSIASMWDKLAGAGLITDDIVYVESVVFVRKDNASIKGLEFKKTGVYFFYVNVNGVNYIQKFETKTIHPIAAEFLPEGVGGGGTFIVNVTMDENENYIADKTYSEISEVLANGQIPYCIFGKAVFYLMESDGLLTTYWQENNHSFLNIDPSSLNITTITIDDSNKVKLKNSGTITVTTP